MIAQGSVTYNGEYGENATARISLAVNCNQLQEVASQTIATLNATLNSVTSQLTAIQAEAVQVADDFAKLAAHIATIAGVQAAHTAVTTQAATAGAVWDLTSTIAYLKAQAAVTIGLSNSTLAKLAAEVLSLASEYNRLESDYTALQNKISTLEAQIVDIPATIASIETAITSAASRFENCVVSF